MGFVACDIVALLFNWPGSRLAGEESTHLTSRTTFFTSSAEMLLMCAVPIKNTSCTDVEGGQGIVNKSNGSCTPAAHSQPEGLEGRAAGLWSALSRGLGGLLGVGGGGGGPGKKGGGGHHPTAHPPSVK